MMLSPVEAHEQSDAAERAAPDWWTSPKSPWSAVTAGAARLAEAEPAGRARSDRSEGRHHAGSLPGWSETGWNQHCVHTVRLRDAPSQARTHGRTRKGRFSVAGALNRSQRGVCRGCLSRALPFSSYARCLLTRVGGRLGWD